MYIMNTYIATFNLTRLALESSSDLVIPSDYFNRQGLFIISNNGNLKRIEIGNNTFGSVWLFELNGLSELQSVEIGEKSFNGGRNDGGCRITNCPKLKSIRIGDDSFSHYSSTFELTNLPCLQSVDIGASTFLHASLSLTGMIGLMMISRSSSTTISQTGWWRILVLSFGCV